MPEIIDRPKRIDAAGDPPKVIDEYVGRARTGDDRLSIARMHSPEGWSEPGQRPDFDEVTIVLAGELHIEHEGGSLVVSEGQVVLTRAGEWIRYSTPVVGGAEYIAVCSPAFSPESVHRDPR